MCVGRYKGQFIVSISDNTTRHNGKLSGFVFLKSLNGRTLYLISFKAQGKCELYSEKVSAVYLHCFALFAVKQLA
jgi:hypothetical protein